MDWLRKLPEAPRFMVLQSVSIQGSRQPGQPLLASVPVTLYMWTGVTPAPTTVAAPAAGTGATAGPRGGRGMGGPRGGRGMGGPRGGRGMGGPRGGRGMRGGAMR
jgi:hypothetical protein